LRSHPKALPLCHSRSGFLACSRTISPGCEDYLHQGSDCNVSATVGTRDAVLVELQLGGSARHSGYQYTGGQSLREELLLWRCFRRDRATAFRVIILCVIDSVAYRITPHQSGNKRTKQLGNGRSVRHARIEPEVIVGRIKDHRHPVVSGRCYCVRCCRQDRAGLHHRASGISPALPESGESE